VQKDFCNTIPQSRLVPRSKSRAYKPKSGGACRQARTGMTGGRDQ